MLTKVLESLNLSTLLLLFPPSHVYYDGNTPSWGLDTNFEEGKKVRNVHCNRRYMLRARGRCKRKRNDTSNDTRRYRSNRDADGYTPTHLWLGKEVHDVKVRWAAFVSQASQSHSVPRQCTTLIFLLRTTVIANDMPERVQEYFCSSWLVWYTDQLLPCITLMHHDDNDTLLVCVINDAVLISILIARLIMPSII